MMLSELAPGVFHWDHRVVEGKNGIVLGSHGAVAIDAGNDPEEGQAAAALLQERGRPPRRLVLTHGHGDHMLGAGAFRGGEILAHAAAPAVIERQIPGWAARSGETVDALRQRLAWPTATFTGEAVLYLGDKTLHLFPTPGHSEDGVCAYVIEDRVLFAGDTVVTGIVPAIGDGDSVALERSLRGLIEKEIEVLVPGHGPVLHGGDRVRAWLQWLVAYLGGIRDFVRQELTRGVKPEAIADAAAYDAFVGERLPADRHGMPRRHRDTVLKIIREVDHERD
jgi:cyclase